MGGMVHPDCNPNKEAYIYARHPDWDGVVEHLDVFLNRREGNFYEIYYRKETNEWFWLDYYFNFDKKSTDFREAVLGGAAESCYWATDYEEFEKREQQ